MGIVVTGSDIIGSDVTRIGSCEPEPENICGKEFSRLDTKKRHEESHSYTITCRVCGKFLIEGKAYSVTGLCPKDLK
jgi:hypothetical protein